MKLSKNPHDQKKMKIIILQKYLPKYIDCSVNSSSCIYVTIQFTRINSWLQIISLLDLTTGLYTYTQISWKEMLKIFDAIFSYNYVL